MKTITIDQLMDTYDLEREEVCEALGVPIESDVVNERSAKTKLDNWTAEDEDIDESIDDGGESGEDETEDPAVPLADGPIDNPSGGRNTAGF